VILAWVIQILAILIRIRLDWDKIAYFIEIFIEIKVLLIRIKLYLAKISRFIEISIEIKAFQLG